MGENIERRWRGRKNRWAHARKW